MPVFRMQSEGAAEGEVSRREQSEEDVCPGCHGLLAFDAKFFMVPKMGEPREGSSLQQR